MVMIIVTYLSQRFSLNDEYQLLGTPPVIANDTHSSAPFEFLNMILLYEILNRISKLELVYPTLCKSLFWIDTKALKLRRSTNAFSILVRTQLGIQFLLLHLRHIGFFGPGCDQF